MAAVAPDRTVGTDVGASEAVPIDSAPTNVAGSAERSVGVDGGAGLGSAIAPDAASWPASPTIDSMAEFGGDDTPAASAKAPEEANAVATPDCPSGETCIAALDAV